MITTGDSLVVKEYNITTFYQQLKNLPIMNHQELNIEAVAFQKGQVFLFNRGRNVVFVFLYSELIKHFNGEIPFPSPKTTLFELPSIDGIASGFSGATILHDQPVLLFTSSVENTPNAYDDGAVLGSFVGMIDISSGTVPETFIATRIPDQIHPLKVETIAIDEIKSNNQADVILASDSDGGTSMVLKCRLEW